MRKGNHASLGKFFMLMALKKRPHHGYEMMSELEKSTGKKPSTGQIYPMLESLRNNGFVTSESKIVNGRKRKTYSLTKKGNNLVFALNKKFSIITKIMISSRLKKCAHCSCEVLKGSISKKIRGKKFHFCCKPCMKSYKH